MVPRFLHGGCHTKLILVDNRVSSKVIHDIRKLKSTATFLAYVVKRYRDAFVSLSSRDIRSLRLERVKINVSIAFLWIVSQACTGPSLNF